MSDEVKALKDMSNENLLDRDVQAGDENESVGKINFVHDIL